jgi:D-inositol-3-phosphate glycosyltransferase
MRVVPRLDDDGLRRLYHESALLLVPSRLEGMPFTMLEAMACGTPTLAAANSGMRDAVVEGENGWLLSTFEPKAWAAKVIELLASPSRLRAASDSARAHAESFRLRPLSEAALSWYDSLPP